MNVQDMSSKDLRDLYHRISEWFREAREKPHLFDSPMARALGDQADAIHAELARRGLWPSGTAGRPEAADVREAHA
jgi:hypothetical protein